MIDQSELFASNLIAFWRKWHDGDPLGDCPEWIELSSLVKERPDQAIRLIATVVRRDPDGLTFECLSGCVTDLLRANGSVVLDPLSDESRAEPLFSKMLGEIPLTHVPEDCRLRLSQIATANTTPTSARVESRAVGQGKVVVLRGERRSWLGAVRNLLARWLK